jgi:pyrroline-5-carboxylate reductase
MNILIIGGGNMGLTYANSFLRSHIVTQESLMILEKNKNKADELEAANVGKIYTDPADCLDVADLVIFAVKPQDSPELLKSLSGNLDAQQVFLTIMAGIKLQTIADGLQVSKIIRAMPNLPAQIGMGMTVFTSTDEVTRIELIMVQNLLNTTGKAIYVENEALIDAATAISGSGPAYVFYLMQSIMKAAEDMGFTAPEAELLTWQTFMGAIDLFHKNNYTCSEWIKMVSSPGGTTEAAMAYFKKNHVDQHLQGGAHAALERARELGRTKD